MLGLGLMCLFLFCSKYMSAVNLAAFNIITHCPLMRILLLKLLSLPFSCNSRIFLYLTASVINPRQEVMFQLSTVA